MSWFHGAAARTRLIFRRGAREARMEKEFAFHIDMEAQRLIPRTARRTR